jgi:flagellar protein FlaJ
MPPSTTTPPEGKIIKKYRSFCYSLIGERLDREKPDDVLSEKLHQAGMNLTPGMHTSVMIVSTILATVVSFVVALVIFDVILAISDWILYVLLITGIAAATVAGMFRFLINSRISNRREQLERELPFTLSELSVMASTGMSPIELVHRMAKRDHDPAMTYEFKRIAYKTDIQGKDLITALAETAKESPSNSLRESLWDLANMIHQGGSLDEYLRDKSEDVLKLKRVTQKDFIERLNTFVDMYISIVLIGVLLIGVGAFLINAFGSTMMGLDANSLLLLLTYGIVPLSVIVTTILVSIAYHRAE